VSERQARAEGTENLLREEILRLAQAGLQ